MILTAHGRKCESQNGCVCVCERLIQGLHELRRSLKFYLEIYTGILFAR